MLCDNCRENKATVRYTEIINGNKREMMLCEECSRKLGINKMSLKLPIDFSSFFGDFLSEYEKNDLLPLFSENPNMLKCKTCNMTYKDFLNTGKLGCADCYDTFEDEIDQILRRVQGSSEYLGRKGSFETIDENKEKPKIIKKEKNDKKREIDELQRKLKDAIKDERYEDAAKIRDEIKEKENN